MQCMEQFHAVIDRVIISKLVYNTIMPLYSLVLIRQDDSLYETLASCIGRLGAVVGGGPIHNDSIQ